MKAIEKVMGMMSLKNELESTLKELKSIEGSSEGGFDKCAGVMFLSDAVHHVRVTKRPGLTKALLSTAIDHVALELDTLTGQILEVEKQLQKLEKEKTND